VFPARRRVGHGVRMSERYRLEHRFIQSAHACASPAPHARSMVLQACSTVISCKNRLSAGLRGVVAGAALEEEPPVVAGGGSASTAVHAPKETITLVAKVKRIFIFSWIRGSRCESARAVY
jgi:hypothetical protein